MRDRLCAAAALYGLAGLWLGGCAGTPPHPEPIVGERLHEPPPSPPSAVFRTFASAPVDASSVPAPSPSIDRPSIDLSLIELPSIDRPSIDVIGPTAGQGKSEGTSEKSYWIPAAEILAFEFGLNEYDRHYVDDRTYGTDSTSIQDNLHSGWVIDRDPFAVNQILHPYAGSTYFGFARSAGLGFWTSMGYAFGGSALWEVAGETTPPSLNDQITTSFGGSFLGEAVFRTANWILEEGGSRPGFVRKLGAAAFSPPTGFNRLAFGQRFRHVSATEDPAVLTQLSVGAKRTRIPAQGGPRGDDRTDALAEFSIDYGMPGKSGYTYNRPFDYFHLDFAGTSNVDNHMDRLSARGLLWGDKYDLGADYRGIWGLYGSYDYLSPEVFRLASTALSIGTTAQELLTDDMTLQGSLLAGFGFAAAGTIADDQSDRDYHYGATPQGLLDLRFLFGKSAMFELTGRDYEVGGSGYNQNGGRENVLQAEASLTWRVGGPHALSLQYIGSYRDAKYQIADNKTQSVASIALVYTFLGGMRLGAVR